MLRAKPIISLVGCKCVIVRKSDGVRQSLLIVGESANTVLARSKRGLKRIPKRGHVFEVFTEEGLLIADGDLLVGRPAQRIKRVRRGWMKS